MIKTRLVKLLSHAKRYIVFQVLWQWLSLLCQVLMLYSASVLIEKALFGILNIQEVWQYGAIIAGALIIRFFCDRQASYASFKASVDVKRILREKIYGKLLRLGVSYRESVATSEVVQMAAEGVEQLETYFGRYLPQLFYSLLVCHSGFCQLEGKPCAVDLRTAHSHIHCGGPEICKEAFKQILGNIYGIRRQLP